MSLTRVFTGFHHLLLGPEYRAASQSADLPSFCMCMFIFQISSVYMKRCLTLNNANPTDAKLFIWSFHPLEAVSR